MIASNLKPTSKPVSIKLDPDTKARLDALAIIEDRSPHWLMQTAILTYLDHAEYEHKLRQDAIAAYEDYQQTGLHLDGPTADAWMKELIAGIDAPIPPWQK
jgi:predicted transcriptional regulator